MEGGGLFPLLRAKALVAGTHGQPALLAYDGRHDYLCRNRKRAGHVLNDEELLVILLAHEELIRFNDIEQAFDHLGYAVEMAGAEAALHRLVEALEIQVDAGVKPCGVDLFGGGHKNYVATGLIEHRQVLRRGSGVFFQVGRFVKLSGVDKNAGYGTLCRLQGLAHQGEVPFVQCPHSGDKTNGSIFAPVGFQELPEGLCFFEKIHLVWVDFFPPAGWLKNQYANIGVFVNRVLSWA